MKYVTLLILCIASGCANTHSVDTASADNSSATVATQRYYKPTAAAALAFDPPIASNMPMPDLSREGRSPAAFAGYEQAVTSTTYTHQRDEIRFDFGGNGSRFERTAYSDTTATISR